MLYGMILINSLNLRSLSAISVGHIEFHFFILTVVCVKYTLCTILDLWPEFGKLVICYKAHLIQQ